MVNFSLSSLYVGKILEKIRHMVVDGLTQSCRNTVGGDKGQLGNENYRKVPVCVYVCERVCMCVMSIYRM